MQGQRIGIITPVLNDWVSLQALLAALGDMVALIGRPTVFVVDDCSTEPGDAAALTALGQRLGGLEVIRLACNLGHQRAIAVGLAEVARRGGFDLVVVMDADGEDRPEDLPRLLAAHLERPEAIIVATRAERSEGASFRLFYRAYNLVYRLCTGIVIDFGNFCLIPAPQLGRLVAHPEICNHLAASVFRSRSPIRRVPTSRGHRYAGASRMNIIALVAHGLSAISVFTTETFVRFLGLTALLVGAIMATVAASVGGRLLTAWALPGWATTVIGLALVMLLQILTLTLALTFVMLAGRGTAPVLPAEHSRYYIRAVEVLA